MIFRKTILKISSLLVSGSQNLLHQYLNYVSCRKSHIFANLNFLVKQISKILSNQTSSHYFYRKVFWKHAGNLQENTHVEGYFNKIAKQLYWNHTLAVNLLHISRTTFYKHTSGGLLLQRSESFQDCLTTARSLSEKCSEYRIRFFLKKL